MEGSPKSPAEPESERASVPAVGSTDLVAATVEAVRRPPHFPRNYRPIKGKASDSAEAGPPRREEKGGRGSFPVLKTSCVSHCGPR
jgi:hypothetical protein